MNPQESQPENALSFCTFCQTLVKEISTDPSTWNGTTRDYQSRTTVLDILETASTCRLCELIISSNVELYFRGSRFYDRTIKSHFASLRKTPSETIVAPIHVVLITRRGVIAQCTLYIPLMELETAHYDLSLTAGNGIALFYILKLPLQTLKSYSRESCCDIRRCEHYHTSKLISSMLPN